MIHRVRMLVVIVAGTLLAAPGVLWASSGTSHGAEAAPQSAEEARVVAAIDALFDAMAAKDKQALTAIFHPEARLLSVPDPEMGQGVQETPIDAFIRSIGGAAGELEEVIEDPRVRIDGRLATVWTPYRFYLDGQLSHCGVNAFHLVKGEDGVWTILHITDTRRRSCG